MRRRLAFIHIHPCINWNYLLEETMMRKMKFGIMILVAVIALVSVASAALPSGVSATMHYPNAPNAYWAVDILAPGVNPEVPAMAGYDGYCIDPAHYLSSGSTYAFMAYTSLDGGAQYQIDHPGAPNAAWNKVNYILNNDPTTADPSKKWVLRQAAIWHYDGMPTGYPSGGGLPSYSTDEYDDYIDQIDAAVDENGWQLPLCGADYAVILYQENKQVVIIPVPLEDCENTPEFPSLALPVAMLIGMIGIVQFMRTRE
jgi:hypothetical protein